MAIDASLTQLDIQHISVLQESSFTSVSFVGRFGINTILAMIRTFFRMMEEL
jgi:hypothetical protein